jgi:hypothetical protein
MKQVQAYASLDNEVASCGVSSIKQLYCNRIQPFSVDSIQDGSLLQHTYLITTVQCHYWLSKHTKQYLNINSCPAAASLLALIRFLTYRHQFPIGQPKFTWTANSYITCYPLTHSLFIALMMNAVCTPEMSVNLNVTTWRYIPEAVNIN